MINIKNADEAREMIQRSIKNGHKVNSRQHDEYWSAVNYLAALTGPEWIERERIMKALVEILIRLEIAGGFILADVKAALAQYRAAAKEIK